MPARAVLPTHRAVPVDAPIGTLVIFRSIALAGQKPATDCDRRIRTVSLPWRLPTGAIVVRVEGRDHPVALCALELPPEVAQGVLNFSRCAS